MKKTEFMRLLAFRVTHLTLKEREDILVYYNSIINDRMECGEEEEVIIASLGSIDSIVNNLSEVTDDKNSTPPVVELNPSLAPFLKEESVKITEVIQSEAPQEDKKKKKTKKDKKGKKKKKVEEAEVVEDEKPKVKKEKKKRTAGQILVVVLTFPLWFSLLMVIFALALSFSICYIALFFAFGFVSIAGFAVTVGSFLHMSANLFGGFFQLGVGILTIALGILFVYLLTLLTKGLWKAFAKFGAWIGGN